MIEEILHKANIFTNLMVDPSPQIIVGSSRQTEDASNLEGPLESLTEVRP